MNRLNLRHLFFIPFLFTSLAFSADLEKEMVVSDIQAIESKLNQQELSFIGLEKIEKRLLDIGKLAALCISNRVQALKDIGHVNQSLVKSQTTMNFSKDIIRMQEQKSVLEQEKLDCELGLYKVHDFSVHDNFSYICSM